MPPRVKLFQCVKSQTTTPALSICRPFTSSPPCHISTPKQKRLHRDPYALAQARARKAANLSRRKGLEKERVLALGDPVRGITTPFVQSFDTATSPVATVQTGPTDQSPTSAAKDDGLLNFFLRKSELDEGLVRSKWLNTPPPENLELDIQTTYLTPEQHQERVQQEQDTASEALQRIASLSLGSSQDRHRVNTRRCIETFGRHNTDHSLPAKPVAPLPNTGSQPEKTPRIGPDTGSSEVQIAILTAKIRTLSEFLQTRGTMDKVNKRNLRLLVHRRQKLLQYLRRKERGGPRWQHVTETLGLTDGTWKGEISL